MRVAAIAVAALAAGCASSDSGDTLAADAALTAIQNARVRECPPDRTQTLARSDGEHVRHGVTERVVGTIALPNQRGTFRSRRLDIEPGGVIQWHDHVTRQGFALIIAGEMTEYRNSCLDPMRYTVGDVAREDAETAHYWRNESGAPASILVSEVLE